MMLSLTTVHKLRGEGKIRGFFTGIHSFHQKAKRVMEDFGRKVGKWVVDEAERMDVIKLECFKNLIKSVDKLPREFRDKLYLI
jgi:hypothetical protein